MQEGIKHEHRSLSSRQEEGVDGKEMEQWEGAIAEQALLTDSAVWYQQLLWSEAVVKAEAMMTAARPCPQRA